MKHHYVPQFYLRSWLGSDHKIQYHTKNNGRWVTSRVSPKHTACEHNLYSFSGNSNKGDRHALETLFLSPLDASASNVFRKISKDSVRTLTSDDRYFFSYFLASLLYRGPNFLNPFVEEAIASHLETFQESYVEAQIDSITLLETLVSNPETINSLLAMNWNVISLSDTRFHLMTSSDPLIVNQFPLDGKDAVLALPISPWQLFVAANDRHIVDWLESDDSKALAWSASWLLAKEPQYMYGFVDEFVLGCRDFGTWGDQLKKVAP